MTQSIIFVDLDGPCLSRKSHMFHENRRTGINPETGIGYYPKFDEFSVRAFNLWAKYGGAKIVFSTAWAHSYTVDQLKDIMRYNGLGFDYHDEVLTPKKMSSLRCHEIAWWLEKHSDDGDKFIAVDDDTSCQDLASIIERSNVKATGDWIAVDYDNGLSWDNFIDGCVVLGIDLDVIYEKEFGIKPLTESQKRVRLGLTDYLL